MRPSRDSPVVHQDVAALDVPVQEILLVTIIQPVQELFHDARVVHLVEIHHSGLQQSHQVVVHVLEHQIERSLVLSKIDGVLLVRHYLPQVDDVLVVELSQDLYLSDGGDGEALLLVLESHLLQGHQLAGIDVFGFVHLTVGAFADLRNHLEHVHAPLAPVFAADRLEVARTSTFQYLGALEARLRRRFRLFPDFVVDDARRSVGDVVVAAQFFCSGNH
jgi:hypothetical protein